MSPNERSHFSSIPNLDSLEESTFIGLNERNLYYELDTEATPMLTISEIIEHIFCPRFTYFIHCLNISQHEELRYKVLLGRNLHGKKEKQNIDYLRKRVGCIGKEISVYLASKELRIRGLVDEILYLDDGSLAPLDYKHAEYNNFTFKTHRIQSAAYAILIRQNYNKQVHKGFICYARNGNKLVAINYTERDFSFIQEIVSEIFYIIQHSFFPKKSSWPNKCIDCCYRNICMPI